MAKTFPEAGANGASASNYNSCLSLAGRAGALSGWISQYKVAAALDVSIICKFSALLGTGEHIAALFTAPWSLPGTTDGTAF